MANYSRREFLRQMGTVSGLLLTGRHAFSTPYVDFSQDSGSFEFLVIGDSLIWGQGLREEQKFYTLTKDWLQTEVFAGSRPVNLKVKAHSGSTLTLHADAAAGLRRAGRDESQYAHPEINVAFPSIAKQIDLAADEYKRENIAAESVGLIMLSGGITDIGPSKVLDTDGDDDALRRDIVKYCRDDMIGVLRRAAAAFPMAKIAVIGYFPMISPQTPTSKLTNAYLEVRRVPDPLKPFVNNALLRRFFKSDKKRGVERSRIWIEDSDRNLQQAVETFNSERKSASAVFIKSPLAEDNALETKNTMLFRMKKGKVEDFLYAERKMVCEKELEQLKASTGLKYSVRLCEISAIGHPNPEGSGRYAEAIKAKLGPLFQGRQAIATPASRFRVMPGRRQDSSQDGGVTSLSFLHLTRYSY